MMRWDCMDIDRDAIIHELMFEAGLTDDPALTNSLASLGSFASTPAPVPGPALAAMLAGTATGASTATGAGAGIGGPADKLPVDELGKRRDSRKHRPAVIGAAVLTAMGLGVGGVAASSAGSGKGTPDFMQALISGWAPGWTTAPPSLVPPAPNRDSPKVTTHPAPADPPAPTVAPAPSVPPALEAVVPSAAEPSTGAVAPSSVDPAAVKAPTKQGAAGQPEVPMAGPPDPTVDSLPKSNGIEFQDALKQVLQQNKDEVAATSRETSLRWLFGLAR